jgi:hypothetical protein
MTIALALDRNIPEKPADEFVTNSHFSHLMLGVAKAGRSIDRRLEVSAPVGQI